MAHADPATVAAAWAAGLKRSNAKITAGVNAVTVAPQSQAANAAQKWQTNVSSAAAMAKFQASLRRQTLADWSGPMLSKGIPRIGTGADAAQPKFTAFMSQFLPYLDSVTAAVRAMPSATLDDNIARMEAQIRGVAKFRRGQ